MGLSLDGVNKIIGRETHLNDINLEFESGSLNILLGRTLAGKTSLLRILAGLDSDLDLSTLIHNLVSTSSCHW